MYRGPDKKYWWAGFGPRAILCPPLLYTDTKHKIGFSLELKLRTVVRHTNIEKDHHLFMILIVLLFVSLIRAMQNLIYF